MARKHDMARADQQERARRTARERGRRGEPCPFPENTKLAACWREGARELATIREAIG